MRPTTAFLLTAILAAVLLVHVFGTEGANAAAASNQVSYVAADKCCVGCNYNSGGCCCGRHVGKPATVTKKVTKTLLKTKTTTVIVAKRALRLARRTDDDQHVDSDYAITTHESYEIKHDISTSHNDASAPHLFARHLCPTCPKGATVRKPGKNNGGKNQVVFCCPRAATRTVTRTVRTVTRFMTKTTSVAKPIIIQGRLYRDVNNNNQWDAGIDLPFSNEAVLLYLLPSSKLTRRNAPGEEIASNVTDSRGQFTFTVSDRTQVPPGANLGMAIRSNPDVVLKTFEAGSGGEMEYVDTPVEVGTTTVVGRTTTKNQQQPATTAAGAQTTTNKLTTKAAGGTTSQAAGQPTTTNAAAATTTAVKTSTVTKTQTPSSTTISPLVPTVTFWPASDLFSTTDIRAAGSDSSGNVWLYGQFADWATFAGNVNITNSDPFLNISSPGSPTDAFLVKLNPHLNVTLWTAVLGSDGGSSENPPANGMAVDAAGNAYVFGQTLNLENSTLTINGVPRPELDHALYYVVKFDTSGAVVWAKGVGDNLQFLGGAGSYVAWSCSLGTSVFYCGAGLSGLANGDPVSIVDGAFNITMPGAVGSVQVQGWYFGLSIVDGSMVAADKVTLTAGDVSNCGSAVTAAVAGADGTYYLTGSYVCNSTFAGLAMTDVGGATTDMFLAKMFQNGTAAWITTCGDPAATGTTSGLGLAYDEASGSVIVTGSQASTIICNGVTTITNDPNWPAASYGTYGFVLKVNGADGQVSSFRTVAGFTDASALTISNIKMKTDGTFVFAGYTDEKMLAWYPPAGNASLPFVSLGGQNVNAAFAVHQRVVDLEVLHVQAMTMQVRDVKNTGGLTTVPGLGVVLAGTVTLDTATYGNSMPIYVNGTEWRQNATEARQFYIMKTTPDLQV